MMEDGFQRWRRGGQEARENGVEEKTTEGREEMREKEKSGEEL